VERRAFGRYEPGLEGFVRIRRIPVGTPE